MSDVDLGKFESLSVEDKKRVLEFVTQNIRSTFVEINVYETKAELDEEGEYSVDDGDLIETIETQFVECRCFYGFKQGDDWPCAEWKAVNDAQMLEHAMWHLEFREKDVNEE